MRFLLSILLSTACLAPPVLQGQTGTFTDSLDPFFETHCYECHDDTTTKGGLDLLALSNNLTNPKTFAEWERIYDRVTKGEMPPEKKPRPESEVV